MADAGSEFEEILPLYLEPGNSCCCDTGVDAPLWASVSHGIYLSIDAAGIHRSLGVRTSFVLSLTLDSWTPAQKRMMELGGNQRWTDFLTEQGVPKELPIRQKYSTRAAEWYRAKLRAEAEELEPPEPLPPGTGHLPMHSNQDQTLAVLDRVFATVQCRSNTKHKTDPSMSSVEIHARAEGLKRKQRRANSASEWVCQQLQSLVDDLLLVSEGDRAAVKLQEMSTGKMTGFSCDKWVPPKPELIEGQPKAVESGETSTR
jgi:hypothetical protein